MTPSDSTAAARALGRLGGLAGSEAQAKARAQHLNRSGRPRIKAPRRRSVIRERVLRDCEALGLPVLDVGVVLGSAQHAANGMPGVVGLAWAGDPPEDPGAIYAELVRRYAFPKGFELRFLDPKEVPA